jgi:hypothetical protein
MLSVTHIACMALISIFFFSPRTSSAAPCRDGGIRDIGILVPQSLLHSPVAISAIEDTKKLLEKGFPNVKVLVNRPHSSVTIILPAVHKGNSDETRRFFSNAPQEYKWISSCRSDGTVQLRLYAASPEAVSFGLYGLLQEKLGYKFYHPREMIIPSHRRWPLPAAFMWEARPRFEKRGFHLHTLHPIELTPALNDSSGNLGEVKEYIDWLARNGQNVFQFFLLRDVDRQRWPARARWIVKYAHSRGILAGVEISLSRTQQAAFQAVKLLSLRLSLGEQVEKTLSWLFQADWDFVTVDFTIGEYLPDLGGLMPELREKMLAGIARRGAKPFYATHVIAGANWYSEPSTTAGILIHTVMCYSAAEATAPVYGNKNQRHMLALTLHEAPKRETWYWPESAYWVSFDNSVPLLLLLYPEARFQDIVLMEKLGIHGHLTFSSGWEWCYWLTDWSIARWCWKYAEKGREETAHPLSILYTLLPGKRLRGLWQQALDLQRIYLKEKGLLPYLSALDPSAELFFPFNRPFQPRPRYPFHLLSSATETELEKARKDISLLDEYASKIESLSRMIESAAEKKHRSDPYFAKIHRELLSGLRITALRAQHRALTIKALMLGKIKGKDEMERCLARARDIRLAAFTLVQDVEKTYRYPIERLAGKGKNLTVYEFGYLYPVHDLFFWEREEEQVRAWRFDAFFMDIWDFRRVLGLESLWSGPTSR